MANNPKFTLLLSLARPLCPCSERTAARGSGVLAAGAAQLTIRYDMGRYKLHLECPYCGASVEEDFGATLHLDIVAPPPGPGALTFKATQLPGKA